MTGPRYALDELDWVRVDDLLEKKVVHGQRMTVTNYRFAARGRFPNHVHPQEQITYCLQGEVRFVVDGRRVTLGPGELVVIPPEVPHEAEAGPAGALVLSMVSPSRAGEAASGITLLEQS